MSTTRWASGWRVRVLAFLCASLGSCPLWADDSRFEIRNAYVDLTAVGWQLHARLDIGLSEAASRALDEGVPLTLKVEAQVHGERRFLPDEHIVSVDRQWLLEHDAIADRYVVAEQGSEQQQNFSSREEALAALARIDGMALVQEEQLEKGGRYEVSLRATVEIGGLPGAVKVLLFWRDWSRTTDWYIWGLKP